MVLRLIGKPYLVVIDQLEVVSRGDEWTAFLQFLRRWEVDGRKSSVVITTPRRAPSLAPEPSSQPEDDWWERSLPQSNPQPNKPGNNRWIAFTVFAIVVIVLLLLFL